MTTSGTAGFNLDLNELVEEAYERCGAELRTGYDLKTARRSLNLMFADWANRGINMWTMEAGLINLVQGQSTYPLPLDTVDLLEHVIRTGGNVAATQADLTITRISVSTYATIPNKIQQARPIQILINRMDGQVYANGAFVPALVASTDTQITLSSTVGLPAYGFIKINNEVIFYSYITGNTLYNCFRGQANTTAASHVAGSSISIAQYPSFTVWPVPDNAQQYQLAYWRLRRNQDAGQGINTMDVPFRFIPAMVAGLSYHLAMKIAGADVRLPALKAQYDEAWQLASEEDREKAAVRFVPREMYIGGG
jgi:hypothetical protein